MKRLSSNLIYLTAITPIVGLVGLITEYINGDLRGSNFMLFIIVFASVFAYLIYYISKSRRVYVKDSTLYIYSLFSNKHFIIDKDKFGNIERTQFMNFSHYQVLYYDDANNDKYIYFLKNWLLFDFSDIVDQLNDVQ